MDVRQVIRDSSVSIGDFTSYVGYNAPASPTAGDCATYAAVFHDVLNADGIYGTFVPDVEVADCPMHVMIQIGDTLYDGTGTVNRANLISRTTDILFERYPEYAESLDNPEKHVKRNAGTIQPEWVGKYHIYDKHLHQKN